MPPSRRSRETMRRRPAGIATRMRRSETGSSAFEGAARVRPTGLATSWTQRETCMNPGREVHQKEREYRAFESTQVPAATGR